MQKLLIVCGPTSIGKTALAIKLAKKFNGEIISADSRQVYRGLDIGTGKEWGEGVKIWGYDLAGPKQEYSVSQYLKFASKTIKEIKKRGYLPILVGGTGLYIKAVTKGIATINIPRNINLRKGLETKTTPELFEILASLDASKAGSMNVSDKNNPRRLIRAIEVAQYSATKGFKEKEVLENYDTLFIGLEAPRKDLENKIGKRVGLRVKGGIKEEIKTLLGKGVNWHDQSMTSLGYRQWRDFFEGKRSEREVINTWKVEEKKYSRRQMTWFKKGKRINWFNIGRKDYQKKVESLVKRWYITPDAEKN